MKKIIFRKLFKKELFPLYILLFGVLVFTGAFIYSKSHFKTSKVKTTDLEANVTDMPNNEEVLTAETSVTQTPQETKKPTVTSKAITPTLKPTATNTPAPTVEPQATQTPTVTPGLTSTEIPTKSPTSPSATITLTPTPVI